MTNMRLTIRSCSRTHMYARNTQTCTRMYQRCTLSTSLLLGFRSSRHEKDGPLIHSRICVYFTGMRSTRTPIARLQEQRHPLRVAAVMVTERRAGCWLVSCWVPLQCTYMAELCDWFIHIYFVVGVKTLTLNPSSYILFTRSFLLLYCIHIMVSLILVVVNTKTGILVDFTFTTGRLRTRSLGNASHTRSSGWGFQISSG